jgi:hypothetical protein
MKRISSLAVVPFLAALGGCSSSSTAPGSSNSTTNTGGPDGSQMSVRDAGGEGGDDGSGTSSGDDGGSSATPYSATLSGAQVVPAAPTSATGSAKLSLQADNVTLGYDITQNVAGATAVNVHIGAPGETGATTRQLTPVSGHMTGTIMLSMDEQNALSVDQLYIDVPSSAYPGGEIRGQVTVPGSTIYVATATGSQEVPAVMSSYTAHGSFILSPDQTSLLYHVSTTAIPTDVRLHRAIASINGPVAYPLTPPGQLVDGTLQITGMSDPDDLAHGRFYLNIVTAANPAGELRAQALAPGETLYAGVLSGTNEVPPVTSQATGGAQFVLSPDHMQLRYEADVNGILPTAAEIDNAPRGQNGPMLYQLTLAQQEVLGQLSMASADLPKLMGGNVYVNVRTASYAGGELRTQLLRP